MSLTGRVVLVFEPTPKCPKQRKVELPRQRKLELVLGREDANSKNTPDIQLFGEMTSRKHAVIKVDKDQDRVLICDMDTPNGTWRKDVRLEANKLFVWEPGQTMRFGKPRGANAPGQVDLVTLQRIQTPVASGGAVGSASAAAPLGLQLPVAAGAGGTNGHRASTVAPIGPQLPLAAGASGENGHKASAAAPIGPQLPAEATAGGANGHRVQTPRGPAAIGPELPPHMASGSGASGNAIGPQRPPQVDGRGVKRPLEEPQVCKGVKAAKCDKCDQAHPTERCPYFKKARENHKDAWVNYGRQDPLCIGRTSEKCTKQGKVVPQPGDGSCLFHSLCYGLLHASGRRADARLLRSELMNFISKHSTMEIAGDTLEEWIKWDTSRSVEAYTRQMRVSGWGGGIEMAACSILHKINVHVYEGRRHGQFERISCFDAPKPTAKTIHVLYKGGMHFDALVVR